MTKAQSSNKKKKKVGSYPFVTVVISIALALSIIGIFGAIILNAQAFAEYFKGNYQLQVHLTRNISKTETTKIERVLAAEPFVKKTDGKAEIEFRSQEQALSEFLERDQSTSEEEIIGLLGYNPTRPSFIVHIDRRFSKVEQLKRIKLEIEEIRGVYVVDFSAHDESILGTINKTINKVRIILIGITVFSMLTIVLLINNTIKLAMFSQRFLIRSMQLVGAEPSFIQQPFLVRAALHGIIGGAVASAAVWFAMDYARTQINDLHVLDNSRNIFILLSALPVFGGLLGTLSAYRSVRKYLGMSLDDLY